MASPGRILFIDAYDSFSANIAALLRTSLNADVIMIKIDSELGQVEERTLESGEGPLDLLNAFITTFDALVIGPGPGQPDNPKDIGLIPRIWSIAARHTIPVLGICLGFQSLCSTYGLSVTKLPLPCHGHAKQVFHGDEDIFQGTGLVIATNYNSLGVKARHPLLDDLMSRPSSTGSVSSDDTNCSGNSMASIFSSIEHFSGSRIRSDELHPLAWDKDGYLMAVKHPQLPFWGLQFHPESCKSNIECHVILTNWWNLTLQWNKQYRLLASPASKSYKKSALKSTSELANCLDEAPSLINDLIRFTESSSTHVQTWTSKIRRSSHKIAELCKLSCLTGPIAMLESTKKGRYSIYSMPSLASFRVEQVGTTCTLRPCEGDASKRTVSPAACLTAVEQLLRARRVKGVLSIPFWGGFLGYLSHECALDLIDVHGSCSAITKTPNISLLWTERSIIVDHITGFTHVQSIRTQDGEWIEEMTRTIERLGEGHVPDSSRDQPFQTTLSLAQEKLPDKTEYKAKIETCQRHLRAGNSYELCLTSEAQIILPGGNSWPLYQNLRRSNPVPFAAYLQLGKTTILSSSPEQFLTWDRDGTMDMIPMKGTVKKSPDITFAKASQILSTPKESAENLMIADLIRHDLYSTVGWDADVSVVKLCQVVEHETVYQLVSQIRARAPITPGLSADEKQKEVIRYGHKALRQTLPPGSMTGAPKKRSCEILAQLEDRHRGVYSGVLGYLDVGGGGAFSVCIRTAFSNQDEDKDGQQTWRIGAGGAITVLSDPESEWQEMKVKLDSVLKAFRPRDEE